MGKHIKLNLAVAGCQGKRLMSAFMMSSLVFVLFLTALVADSALSDAVQITTSQPYIHDGYTDKLTVNCSYRREFGSGFSSVTSLVLFKTDSTSDNNFREIASITAFSSNAVKATDTMGAQSSGHVDPAQDSFLTLEWSYPHSQVEGNYKCQANGMDGNGSPLTASEITTVADFSVDTEQVLEKIKQMDLKLTSLMKNVENSRNAISQASFSYGGSSYFLSRPSVSNYGDANSLCALYGGYLVELIDLQQYGNITKFLRAHVTTNVAFGATDEGHEGQWTSMTSGAHIGMGYLWAPGEPNGGTNENCMQLSVSSGLFNDVPCYTPNNDWNFRFLCEIRE